MYKPASSKTKSNLNELNKVTAKKNLLHGRDGSSAQFMKLYFNYPLTKKSSDGWSDIFEPKIAVSGKIFEKISGLKKWFLLQQNY